MQPSQTKQLSLTGRSSLYKVDLLFERNYTLHGLETQISGSIRLTLKKGRVQGTAKYTKIDSGYWLEEYSLQCPGFGFFEEWKSQEKSAKWISPLDLPFLLMDRICGDKSDQSWAMIAGGRQRTVGLEMSVEPFDLILDGRSRVQVKALNEKELKLVAPAWKTNISLDLKKID